MSEKSLIRRADEAHKLYNGLVAALRGGTIAWLASGEFLFKLKKDNAFKNVMGDPPRGHQWTWDDFLSQGEIGLPYSSAHKLMTLYAVFKEKLGLPDGALGKVRFYRLKAIAPHITEKNKDKLLEAAEHLSRTDFEHALTKESKGIDQDACSHDFIEAVILECKKCGLRRKNNYKGEKSKGNR